MSKQTIFLADSSYAIRKITERNFAEEPNYTLITFKGGQGLREQLLEVRPHVVLVELKLPEWNGYDVCRFINAEPSLQNTHIYLLRAAFDPVEEDKLQGMQYVDIITKPFDHAVLIENIEKLGAGTVSEPEPALPAEEPVETNIPDMPDMPEDFPEIDDFDAPQGDISFSDIQTAIEEEPAAAEFESTPKADEKTFMPPPRPMEFMGDDVQPSEEITQGSIPTGRDPLSPPPPMDELDNPFADDSLHEQIKEQEKEMGIASITQEAMAIEAAMAQSGSEPSTESEWDDPMLEEDSDKGDTSEVISTSLPSSEEEDDFKHFSFDDNEALGFPDSPAEPETAAHDGFEVQDDEPEGFEINIPDEIDSFDRPKAPSFLDMAAPQPEEEMAEEEAEEPVESPLAADEEPEINPWSAPPESSIYDEFKAEPEEETGYPVEEPRLEQDELMAETEMPSFAEVEPEEEEEEEEINPSQFDDFPGVDDPGNEASYGFGVTPEPDNSLTSETQAVPEEPADVFTSVEEVEMEEPQAVSPAPPPVEIPEPTQVQMPAPSLEAMTSTDREIIMQRIEQNISQTLKDILWDIIPPIAERIIKEEIEVIKKEIAQSVD